MAITAAMPTSFKQELLVAGHDLTASTGDVWYMALYLSSATLGAATTAYTVTGETSGTGYTAGGKIITSVTPITNSTSGCADFADVQWASASFTARGSMIYNSSASNAAAGIYDFGSDKTATGGNFDVQFPAQTASNAVLELA